MQAAPVDPGAVAAQEPGMEAMEDEYGFLIDEGGYFKFKGTSMMTGIGNPMTLVQELVDPSIIERLEGYLGGMVEFLQAVEEKATEMREYWLEVDGGAQLVERSRAAHAEEVARLEAEAVALAESAVDEDEIKLRAIWEIVDADGRHALRRRDAAGLRGDGQELARRQARAHGGEQALPSGGVVEQPKADEKGLQPARPG